MRYLIALFLLPSALWAGEFHLLDGDAALSRAEVMQVTERHLIEFYEGGQSRYSAGGAYSFTYASGGTAYGSFTVNSDGTICISYRNGRSRCDRLVRSHGRLVMLTQGGQRFAIRP
ncbi:hypothetical protein OS189_10360 [Sulfitobacter sp. F26169L]|uniref:hypothetical protein n=1 Tax=Sulfitobacter sp. F26169L TaxID=2996015 RepID=UPI002260A76B|nr:hypothetical protein [Sulfitobacter sp. F26169L]MCX7566743.1 hypothetical protein [Sulfitobacter sp. F26169L]